LPEVFVWSLWNLPRLWLRRCEQVADASRLGGIQVSATPMLPMLSLELEWLS
jgi:hypothetical protein